MKLDGSVPIKYGVRLAMDEKYKALKKSLSELTNIPTNQILLVEILGPVVKVSLLHANMSMQYTVTFSPVDFIKKITEKFNFFFLMFAQKN